MVAMHPNQSSITGPNTAPTVAVPRFWMAKSMRRITTVAGTTARWRPGATTMSPSMAPSTLIAGSPCQQSRPDPGTTG
jgi:hypothetical protein